MSDDRRLRGFSHPIEGITSLQAHWGAILPINEPLFRERFANQLAPYPLRTDGKRGTIGADLKGIPGMIDRTGFTGWEAGGGSTRQPDSNRAPGGRLPLAEGLRGWHPRMSGARVPPSHL